MRVFITGGTGYLGQAVVRELRHSHDLVGLTRSEERAAELEGEGVRAVVGDVREPDGWFAEASKADALVHLASDTEDTEEADRAAVDTLLRAAKKGPGRRMVLYTSGCFVLGETGDEPAAEDAALDHPAAVVGFRPAHEHRVLEATDGGRVTAVIRPVIVYGGDEGLVSAFFRSAVETGASRYVGDGSNRWSLVHRDDVARLYHVVLERAASGIFHATEGSTMRVADIARVASQASGFGGTTHAEPLEEARERLGAAADAMVMDQVVVTRRSPELGWAPRHPSFRQSVEAVYHEWVAARDA
ncbi:MAG TPA: NAD-dependent epimerase/dehydratase family protein [Longimicrobiales bacterium]|nr:NAD-dependent epimerase/dehydratase family protein [Longimicrobiales bacterium]